MSDFPAVSTLSSWQSQQSDTPSDVQHGVIMNKLWPIKMYGGKPKTKLKVYLLKDRNFTENKENALRTTILKSAREKAEREFAPRNPDDKNPFKFKTWEDCANVEFKIVPLTSDADIRILFVDEKSDSWSTVGTDAKNFPHHSMQLQIEDTFPPTESDRRTILHEFGHALGLNHEHQSPAAQERLQLNTAAIKKYYGKSCQENVLDKLEDEELWNYTNFNPKSIMIYRIDKDWQEQGTKYDIVRNLELSDVDQACIGLMYPPDLTEKDNCNQFKKDLVTAGVNEVTAGQMMADFEGNTEGTVAIRLRKLRDRFSKWKTVDGKPKKKKNAKWISFYNPGVDVLQHIDPVLLKQSGVSHFAGEMTKNRLFQSIVKHVVYRAMVQQGIPTNGPIPGAMGIEATKLIAALSMHDKLGQLVEQQRVAFSGEDDNRDSAGSFVTTATEPLT